MCVQPLVQSTREHAHCVLSTIADRHLMVAVQLQVPIKRNAAVHVIRVTGFATRRKRHELCAVSWNGVPSPLPLQWGNTTIAYNRYRYHMTTLVPGPFPKILSQEKLMRRIRREVNCDRMIHDAANNDVMSFLADCRSAEQFSALPCRLFYCCSSAIFAVNPEQLSQARLVSLVQHMWYAKLEQ